MFNDLLKKLKKYFNNLYFNQSYQPILKLVRIGFSKKSQREICLAQIVGKNAFAEFDISYLIGHKKILSAFSHEDVAAISRAHERAMNDTVKNKYTIREIYTHELHQKNVVVIGRMDCPEKTQTISLDELQTNKTLLNQFQPEAAFRLGQIKAIQEIEAERNMMRKIKTLMSNETLTHPQA